MREIKFRVWDKKNKLMTPFDLNIFRRGVDFVEWDTDSLAIMQSTGLTDVNGATIYEGDIVRHTYYPADPEHGTAKETEVIAYWGDCFGFDRCEGNDILPLHDCMALKRTSAVDLEVLGNIYENPNFVSIPD